MSEPAPPNLDRTLDQILGSCDCDACQRYRRAFARRAGAYAAQIEQSLKTRCESQR